MMMGLWLIIHGQNAKEKNKNKNKKMCCQQFTMLQKESQLNLVEFNEFNTNPRE